MRITLFLLLLLPLALQAQFSIGHISTSYIDANRNNRVVDCEIYYPAGVAGNNVPVALGEFPVIVFGHGFTVTWTEYEVWWEEFVPCGYIMVFPTTEGGLAPDHAEFGEDLSFLVNTMLAENLNPASQFFQRHLGTSGVMGHSMGGGAAFLAAATNPTNINTLVTMAAAETTPSAIAAAATITMPSLTLAGSLDCVAPPQDHQIPMYNALNSTYKAYIEITNASHCQFGEASFFSNCVLAEGFACGISGGSFIPIASQHAQMLASTKPWFDFRLKADCDAWPIFHDYLTMTPTHDYDEVGTDGCCPNTLMVQNSIPSGLYEANVQVISDGVVANGANVMFNAGTQICLDPGFEVPANADFMAIIMACQ